MLNTQTYTRQELIELFKTDRLDSIKSKIKRQGYVYTTSGRGNNFTLTIVSTPPRFRNFCIERLGFAPQTDFVRLKIFLHKFFFDESFRNLPYYAMALLLENEMSITYQTLSHWVSILEKKNIIWRSCTDFNYYSVKPEQFPTPITEELYREAWRAYWLDREDGWEISVFRMKQITDGGQPYKLGVILENVFEQETINELKEILQEEIYNGEQSKSDVFAIYQKPKSQ